MRLHSRLTRALNRYRNKDHFNSSTLSQKETLTDLQDLSSLSDWQQHLKGIERRIVEVVIRSLEEGTLKEFQLKEIATFVLDRIDNIKDHTQLIAFLSDLAKLWRVFEPLVLHEEATANKEKDTQAAHDLLTRIKEQGNGVNL